jgi:hypothetical protein
VKERTTIKELNRCTEQTDRLGVKSSKLVEKEGKIQTAERLEQFAIKSYLLGDLPIDQYKFLLDLTFPFTKLDLRKLAKDLERQDFINQIEGVKERVFVLGHNLKDWIRSKKPRG